MKFLLIGWLLFLLTIQTAAQEDCPALEQAAVTESRAWCSAIQSGEVCYGNSPLATGIDGLRLPGDRAGVLDLSALAGSREGGFGVGMIETVTYSEQSWQPVQLSLVLLGAAEVTDLSNEQRDSVVATAVVRDAQGANVRSGPSTDYRVLAALFAGDVLKITGVADGGDWLRVQLPDGETGWISRQAAEVDDAALPVVNREDAAPALLYAPFSDLEVVTAADDARCVGAPESGLLLQTETGQTGRLRVKGLEITLAGTIFLQTPPEQLLTVYVIEGEAAVAGSIVQSGYQISFPIQTDPAIAVTPLISAYDFARLAALPTEILPRYTYIGIDLATLITPAPAGTGSPIANVLVTDRCVITTGPGGSNLRGGPGAEFPVRGVLAMRETAYPISRTMGTDGQVWWELAQNLWVSGVTTVSGGDCVAVPQAERIPALPPSD